MNSSLVKDRICRVFVVLLCMVIIAAGTFLNRSDEVQAAESVKIENFWMTGDKGGFNLMVSGYSERTNLTVTLKFEAPVTLSTDQSAIKVSSSTASKPTVTVTGWNGKGGEPNGSYYIEFKCSAGTIGKPSVNKVSPKVFTPTPTKKAATDTPTPTKKPATNTPTKKPTNTPTKKPTNTATPKPTKKPTDAPEATNTPTPTVTTAPTETSETTATPTPTKAPIETEATGVVPGVVDPTGPDDPTDPTNPGGGGTTDPDGNTPTPTNVPDSKVELKTNKLISYLPWMIGALIIILFVGRFLYLNKGKGYTAKESIMYIIPGTAKTAPRKRSVAPQTTTTTTVTSSQTGAGLASAMKEINAMKAADAGVKAGPAQAATVPGRAPVKRPPQYSSNPNVAQQAKIQAAAPKRPAASAGAATTAAKPVAPAPAGTPGSSAAPAFKPAPAATAAAGAAVAATAAAQTKQAAPAPVQQTPVQQAPGLKPPIKRPAQYSVNHAATATPASNAPTATHVSAAVPAAAAAVAADKSAQPKTPADPMIANKNAVTAPAGKEAFPRKVAPAPAANPKVAPAASPYAAQAPKAPAASPFAAPAAQAPAQQTPAPAPQTADTGDKGHGIKGFVGKLPFGKKAPQPAQPVAYPKTASTSGTTNYAAAMKEIAAERRAEANANPVPAAPNNAPVANAPAPGLKPPIKRPAQYSVNHAAAAPAPVNGQPAVNPAAQPFRPAQATPATPVQQAPGLKPPIKRPAQYSVNHAAASSAPVNGQPAVNPAAQPFRPAQNGPAMTPMATPAANPGARPQQLFAAPQMPQQPQQPVAAQPFRPAQAGPGATPMATSATNPGARPQQPFAAPQMPQQPQQPVAAPQQQRKPVWNIPATQQAPNPNMMGNDTVARSRDIPPQPQFPVHTVPTPPPANLARSSYFSGNQNPQVPVTNNGYASAYPGMVQPAGQINNAPGVANAGGMNYTPSRSEPEPPSPFKPIGADNAQSAPPGLKPPIKRPKSASINRMQAEPNPEDGYNTNR